MLLILENTRKLINAMSAAPRQRLISSGKAFEAQIGYSRAVVDGDFIFVSGCTGSVARASHVFSLDIADQDPTSPKLRLPSTRYLKRRGRAS